MTSPRSTLNTLCQNLDLTQPGLVVKIDNWAIKIHSNAPSLLAYLADYFEGLAHFSADSLPNGQTIFALQTQTTHELAALYTLPFEDWQREPGKTGRKEAVFDWFDQPKQPQRLVHKVKTGLMLWQSQQQLGVFGDLTAHPNQVINFILSQYLNHWQQAGWLLGHCAAFQLNDQRGIAIAGVSGGGKSTLMLKLLEQAQGFISNDRILIGMQNGSVMMRGIPKQPRINPGTIVHNSRLHSLIKNHQPYLSLAPEALRALEEKYDAPVTRLYPGLRYQTDAPLKQLYLLNWQVDNPSPTSVNLVDLTQRSDLLKGVMKSSGVFFQAADQAFYQNGQTPDSQAYQVLLAQTQVYEISGRLDFETATQAILNSN